MGDPAFVYQVITRAGHEAEKRFVDDPGRVPGRYRNFVVKAHHYWNGSALKIVQLNTSRELLKQVLEEDDEGVFDVEIEEIVRFKLAGPEEREGIKKLIEFAREEGLTDNYAIEQGVKLLERCRQGYEV